MSRLLQVYTTKNNIGYRLEYYERYVNERYVNELNVNERYVNELNVNERNVI